MALEPQSAPDLRTAVRPTASLPIEETKLNGREASSDELERARRISALLELMAQTATDDGEAARLLHELAELRAHPLRDRAEALEAIRRAAARSSSYGIARSHRRIALASSNRDALDDLTAALEAEARFAPSSGAKAALEAHRGLVLEVVRKNGAAAKRAYEAALTLSPVDVDARLGLLRLALGEDDLASAARHAVALADGNQRRP